MRSVVRLLVLIRDLQYNKTYHKLSIMETVKATSLAGPGGNG